MAEPADNSEVKSWWENQLDWNLADSMADKLQAGGRLLKNIPATLSAYRLGKSSPLDHLETDPVEKITTKMLKPGASAKTPEHSQKMKKGDLSQSMKLKKGEVSQSIKVTRPIPRIIAPPPKPPALIKREQENAQWVRAVNIPTVLTTPAKAEPSLETAKTEDAAKPLVSTPTKPAAISESERADVVDRVTKVVEEKHLTLEQLLDPEFCEYTS